MAHDGWGQVLIGTRLEKTVSSRFLQVWEQIIARGLRQGDASYSVRGMVAHKASNALVRMLLQSHCDSLLMLDSDAVVPFDIISRFAEYEPGFEYDILQAFYCRRGWPPSPIWMKRNALGQMAEYMVTRPDQIDRVDVVGTHCCIIRREVFERMLGDRDPAKFEWFFYPRHEVVSEDAAFSGDAIAAGFRIGATTAIHAEHISELATGWDTYIDYLHLTGRVTLLERYGQLGQMVAEFSGEPLELVLARAQNGAAEVGTAWDEVQPDDPEAVRAFYGQRENGYLYDLVSWNCQPMFERLTAPLRAARSARALVVGPGLGTECQMLLDGGNEVDAFELPGVLREFVAWRFGERVRLVDEIAGEYDLVSAIDVVEHVHPDELAGFLERLDGALRPGGTLVLHYEHEARRLEHYDHGDMVSRWLEQYEKRGESEWQKRL